MFIAHMSDQFGLNHGRVLGTFGANEKSEMKCLDMEIEGITRNAFDVAK